MSHHELDARRMFCPMPVIRTQDKVKELDQAIPWKLCAPIQAHSTTYPPGAELMATR